jgi:hypothetical protein
MAQDGNAMQQLASGLSDFFEWVKQTLADPVAKQALAKDLGGTISADRPLALDDDRAASLRAYRESADPGLEAAVMRLQDVRALFDALRGFVEGIDTGLAATADELIQAAFDLLASNFIRVRYPKLYFWMQFIGFTFDTTSQLGEGGNTVSRFISALLHLLHFVLFGKDFPNGSLQTDVDARSWSFPTLRLAAGGLSFAHKIDDVFKDEDGAPVLQVLYGWDTVPGVSRTVVDQLADRMLTVKLWDRARRGEADPLDKAATLSLALVPRDHGGPGAFVAFGGELDKTHELSPRWQVIGKVSAAAGLAFIAGGPKKFQLAGPLSGAADLQASLGLVSVPVPGQRYAFALPDGSGSRLEIGRAVLSLALGSSGFEWRASLHDCMVVIDGSSIDGFLGSVLPKNTELPFSFGAGYSTGRGFFTTGNVPLLSGRGKAEPPAPAARKTTARARAVLAAAPAPTPPAPPELPVLSTGQQASGLQIPIPIGKSLGPVRFHHAAISIAPGGSAQEPKTELRAGLSFSVELGPVLARVDQVGLRFAIERKADSAQANLHFADLDLGFLPPSGVALAIDAKVVKGGGFLFYDDAKKQYGGVVELEIDKAIALKAIGLLATRLPGGAKGYSLLVLITAEGFKPIPIGMGFSLTGIGGMLAIHRTFNEAALRAGLANRSLESILFPRDPIRNAGTILAQLDAVFPARSGSYLFGPMVRIAWGVPMMLLMDLALLLELGHRHRLVVLGRVRAALPRIDNELVRLTMDVLGILDFDEGSIALDAVLVDSRLLNRFPLTGQMALRARWSAPRGFALAVGGMHRAFTPPANFPTLERIAVSLTTGDNPRLTCEAYFALTSNTVQFGAHAFLYAAAFGFSVQGDIGFDVLIQISPFHFLAEFAAGVQLKKGSRSLFKVRVEGALEGPRPLTVRAKATFEVLWWDVSIRVNRTLVEGERPAPPVAVSAFDQLKAALADARSWHAELPAAQARIVSVREKAAPGGAIRAHPLGVLTVRQSVVPMNLARDIDKFGDSPVAGARRFAVTSITLGTQTQTQGIAAVREDFAPAQYFEMSDESKLASPSYEPMDAGVRFGASDFTLGFGERIDSPLEYETRIIDRQAVAPTPTAPTAPPAPAPPALPRYALTEQRLYAQAWHGAAGRSDLRRGVPTAPDEAPAAPYVAIRPSAWSVAAADTLRALPLAPTEPGAQALRSQLTFAEALAFTRGTKQRQLVRELELVP